MTSEDALEEVATVAREMEAIGDLDRGRGTLACAAGVVATAIAADELRLAVLLEPGGQGVGGAIREDVDDAVPLQVGQDGAVVVPVSEREIVDAEHSLGRERRLGQRPHPPQQRRPADPDAGAPCEPHPRAAAEGQPEILQASLQRAAVAGVPRGEPRGLLGEGPARTAGIPAAEAPHPQVDRHPPLADRPVGERARVAAMDVARAPTAIGTPSGGSPWAGLDDQRIGQDCGADDPYADEVREQQRCPHGPLPFGPAASARPQTEEYAGSARWVARNVCQSHHCCHPPLRPRLSALVRRNRTAY